MKASLNVERWRTVCPIRSPTGRHFPMPDNTKVHLSPLQEPFDAIERLIRTGDTTYREVRRKMDLYFPDVPTFSPFTYVETDTGRVGMVYPPRTIAGRSHVMMWDTDTTEVWLNSSLTAPLDDEENTNA
jgi:hypothetical protein